MITDWVAADGKAHSWGMIRLFVSVGLLLGVVFAVVAKDGDAVSLFNGKDLSGWEGYGGEATNWEVIDGELRSKPGMAGVRMLMTDRDFADFEFTMQFNSPPEVNTGVFFRLPADKKGRPAFIGNEIQIMDETAERYAAKMTEDRRMGAHYSVAPPRVDPPPLRPGEWQSFRMRCEGSHVQVWIDDVLVQDADMAKYPGEVKKAHTGLTEARGRIGLQSKEIPTRFRALRVIEIE